VVLVGKGSPEVVPVLLPLRVHFLMDSAEELLINKFESYNVKIMNGYISGEHRLRVSENRLLMRVFGSVRNKEFIEVYRKFNN
jgi:hypothetical protein